MRKPERTAGRRMTAMAEKRTDTAPGAAQQAARPDPRPQPADSRPVRRVGSITLGLCLVALGICFLCHYFLPGFNWTLVVKVGAPLALIALGGEVIWCASHQSRWKYDFLAVLGCLVLMGGAFCLALLPIVWENVNPANRMQLQNLSETYEDQLYQALDGQVDLDQIDAYLETRYGAKAPKTLQEAGGAGVRFWVGVYLYGPYESAEDFAADCALVMDAVKAQGILPDEVEFSWNSPDQLASMDLILNTPAKMEWTAGQMAQRTLVWTEDQSPAYGGSLDQENDTPADSAPAQESAASSSEL